MAVLKSEKPKLPWYKSVFAVGAATWVVGTLDTLLVYIVSLRGNWDLIDWSLIGAGAILAIRQGVTHLSAYLSKSDIAPAPGDAVAPRQDSAPPFAYPPAPTVPPKKPDLNPVPRPELHPDLDRELFPDEFTAPDIDVGVWADTNAIDHKMLVAELEDEEGRVYAVYIDSKDNLTAGVGHLLDPSDEPYYSGGKDTPVPPAQVDAWFKTDVAEAIADARAIFPAFESFPRVVKHVLINMCFQMGRERVSGFKKTIALVNARQWHAASKEMLDSDWYREDTPGRAQRMSIKMASAETGVQA